MGWKTDLRTRLDQNEPREIAVDFPEAGILVPITDSDNPEIILTQRAPHLKTHRGQVAFPGGKRDEDDEDLRATALRESEEEIALKPGSVELFGRLSQVISRHEIVVTPYVGVVPEGVELEANPAEIDSVFRVPVDFFLEDKRLRTDKLSFMNFSLYVPCWEWQGYHVWGMSAVVLVDLLNVGFGANIDLRQPPIAEE
ncbi:CoA pyrophosphatase [Marinobacteraceae bacterium S3BR75-40.1]